MPINRKSAENPETDRLALLLDSLRDHAIFMLDPNGFVTSWNAGAEKVKGYRADEVIGRHFSHFFTPEDRANGLPEQILAQARANGRHEAEGWRVRKDGTRFWASVVVDAIRDAAGALKGFAKVTRDMTERRAVQEALRESERQFRLLVAGVTDYALFMLDPNGIVSSWNVGAERIKGYAATEIVGQHFSRFYTEADRAAGVPARALNTAMQEGWFEAEGWRVRKDGTLFWAHVVIDPIRDEEGVPIGFAKITRDITERREAQLALQEAQAQRAHAQKMDALGQLTGGVAHDFNNLLMVVNGHLQAIRTAAADPKILRAVAAIERAARRGETLTRQLLTFSRRQTFHPERVAVGEHVEALRAMLASSIGGSVTLAATIGPEVWPVKVDPGEFELALVNLVINARDAMPEGGMVAFAAENVTLAQGDTGARIEGDFVALRINDTGTGIAPDLLPKVFDPFFTTKRPNKGSGLGLSQVHGFAHQSGGTVTIDSALGRGTIVTLYLPRAMAADAAAGDAPGTERAAGGTVLLVEDNPDVAATCLSMLEELGYEVRIAGDAAAALDAIAAREFDLVVSDIVMAGTMNGIDLARAIAERKSAPPVLLMTGYSDTADAEPQFTVIRKPVQLSALHDAAARLIAEGKSREGNLVRLSDARQRAARADK
ncbi:MAG TPA: PAS domain S-box protein [Stellaceae bacterium]|jgi:PAS domain S-box-containing protein|nr:PAS domain S-box protein [Stellaceae bacterium]